MASIPIWQVRRALETAAHLEMGPVPIVAQERPLIFSDAIFMLARWPLVVGGLTGPVRLGFISRSFREVEGLLRGAGEVLSSGAPPNKGLCASSGASSAGKRSTLPSTEAGETGPKAGDP